MGYSLYIIDNGLEEDLIRYAILQILNRTGERTYWGMDNLPMTESGKKEFEATLTPQSLEYINEPLYKRKITIFKDRTHLAREITLAMVAAKPTIFASDAMMLATIRTNNVLVVANAPTCFDNGLLASIFVVEVHCHCYKAVEL